MLDVRPETPADYDAIRALHDAAFGPSDVEAKLVDLLQPTASTFLSCALSRRTGAR